MKQLFTFIFAFVSVSSFAQLNGDFRSKQSGSWNSASTWEVFDANNLLWTNATGIPGASNSVWIQDGDSVVLTANGVCNDLHLNADIAQGDVGRINCATFSLSIHGKIRTFTGAKGTVPGADVVNQHNNIDFIVARGNGKLIAVGATRDFTIQGQWSIPNNFNGWNFEVNLASNIDTIRIKTNFRAGNIIINRGVVLMDVAVGGALRPDSGTVGTGNLSINNGGTLIMNNTTMSRIGGERFGTFNLNQGGVLILPSGSINNNIAATTINNNGTVISQNGKLPGNSSISGAATFDHYHNLVLQSQLSLTSSITVNGALVLTSDNQLNLNGNTLTYGANAMVEYAGTTAQTTSDVELPATNGPAGISVNNPSGVSLHANRTMRVVRMIQGALNLGANALTYASNGTLEYMGVSAQTSATNEFPATNGPSNLSVGNPSGVTLHAARTISGQLRFISGKLTTTSANILTLASGATTTGADTTRFVDGPLAAVVASANASSVTFPVGKGAHYRPVTLNLTQDAATATTYTAELFNAAPPSRTLPSTLQSVNASRYWSISKGTGAGITNATITAQYFTGDGVTDTALARIARENGSNWDDLGGKGSNPVYGSVTSTTNFTALGNFVIAKAAATNNSLYPYPIVSIDSLQFVTSQKLAAANTLPDYVNPTFKNPVYGDTVQVEGIVTFDPRYYGLSTNRRATFIQSAAGGPWSGIEIMCDPSTVQGWSGGLTTYKTATQFNQNSVPGLKVRYVGLLKNFNGSGPATSGETQLNLLPYPAEIVDLNPVTITPTVVTIDQFMKSDGAGGQTIQHATGEQYEGVYVQFNNVTIVDRSGPNSNRWNWALQDQSGNKITTYDFSAYFRNDNREDTIGPPAIPGTPNFTPPNIGVTLSYVRGVVTETWNSASGTWQYVFSPLLPSDMGPALAQAPVVSNRRRSPVVATSTSPVTVTARITDDSTVVSATLHYAVGMSTTTFTSVPMTLASGTNSDGVWTGTIPAQANGSVVKYYIRGTDNGGRSGFSPDTLATNSAYMVVDGGITSIQQLQMSPYSNGNSIWNNDTLTSVSIRGIVTASSKTNDLGLVTIQDGSSPNSGIFVQAGVGDGIDQWNRGDSVVINACVVRENFNVTTLYNAGGSNHIVAASGKSLPAFVTTLNSDSVHARVASQTEPYEGMLVQFDSVFVINLNADAPSNFGEFAIGKDTSTTVGLRVDDQSNDISANFNTDSLTLKQPLAYLKGILYFSFGNWKMLPRNRDDIAGFKSDYGTSVRNVVAGNIEFNMYPNPAKDVLHLRLINPEFTRSSDALRFMMTDLAGKPVMNTTLPNGMNVLETQFDISALSSGVYFCTIYSGNSAKTVKIIKTR